MTQRRTKEEEEKGGARRGYHTSAKVIIPGSGLYFPPVFIFCWRFASLDADGQIGVREGICWGPVG